MAAIGTEADGVSAPVDATTSPLDEVTGATMAPEDAASAVDADGVATEDMIDEVPRVAEALAQGCASRGVEVGTTA